MEAFRIIDRDEASIADVDTAMKLGTGMPMGPLELSDVCILKKNCIVSHNLYCAIVYWFGYYEVHCRWLG